jgi:hypothetical protein
VNFIKTFFFIFLASYSTWVSASDAGQVFGTDKITGNLRNGGSDLVMTADNILWFIIGLFYFVAIVFTIYGGFLILTSGWEEEKIKKWKNVFIYAILGLIVIFLASQVVRWVIDILSDTDIVWS